MRSSWEVSSPSKSKRSTARPQCFTTTKEDLTMSMVGTYIQPTLVEWPCLEAQHFPREGRTLSPEPKQQPARPPLTLGHGFHCFKASKAPSTSRKDLAQAHPGAEAHNDAKISLDAEDSLDTEGALMLKTLSRASSEDSKQPILQRLQEELDAHQKCLFIHLQMGQISTKLLPEQPVTFPRKRKLTFEEQTALGPPPRETKTDALAPSLLNSLFLLLLHHHLFPPHFTPHHLHIHRRCYQTRLTGRTAYYTLPASLMHLMTLSLGLTHGTTTKWIPSDIDLDLYPAKLSS